jgi:anti-sigma-K factor RskA
LSKAGLPSIFAKFNIKQTPNINGPAIVALVYSNHILKVSRKKSEFLHLLQQQQQDEDETPIHWERL